MPGQIVADPRTLHGHAAELGTVAAQFEAEAYRLRHELGFLINRPDIPNGAALMSAYMTALQALDGAAVSSRQLSGGVSRYAQRVVDCENTMLRSGDGPYARAWSGPGPFAGLAGLFQPLTWPLLAANLAGAPALLTAPWSARQLALKAMNNASAKELRGLYGISNKSAQAIVKARGLKGDLTLAQLAKLPGMDKYQRAAARAALLQHGEMQRLLLAQHMASKLGRVGKVTMRVGNGWAAKMAPHALKITRFTKGLGFLDLAGSTVGFLNEITDDGHDNPELLGNDTVETIAQGGALVTSVAGTAAMVGLVANPVGLAVIGGATVVVVAYYAAPYVWKGGKWVAGKVGDGVGYVGGKIGDGAGYVGDKVGDAKDAAVGAARDTIEDAGRAVGNAKDAVSDKAGDVKDAVSDKAGDAKDAVGHKLGGAKDAVAKKFGGLW
jgi:hypothetical protein